MNHSKLFILIFAVSFPILTVGSGNGNKADQDIYDLEATISNFHEIITSSEIEQNESVLSILEDIQNDYAKVLKHWIIISAQASESDNINWFLQETMEDAQLYLEHLAFDDSTRITSTEYKLIKQRIVEVTKHPQFPEPHRKLYRVAKQDVHVRKLPIVSRLTKQSINNQVLALHKGSVFKLERSIEFYLTSGKIKRWGYGKIVSNERKGWLNLDFIQELN